MEVTPTTAASAAGGPHPLPVRPAFDVFTGASLPTNPTFGGSNSDVVANRAALRLANLSAADAMRAELAGAVPLRSTSRATLSGNEPAPPAENPSPAPVAGADVGMTATDATTEDVEPSVPAFNETATNGTPDATANPEFDMDTKPDGETPAVAGVEDSAVADLIAAAVSTVGGDEKPHGVKRTIDEVETETPSAVEEEPEAEAAKPALKVNADGTVDQEDTVKYGFKLFHIVAHLLTHTLLDSGNLDIRSDTIDPSLA